MNPIHTFSLKNDFIFIDPINGENIIVKNGTYKVIVDNYFLDFRLFGNLEIQEKLFDIVPIPENEIKNKFIKNKFVFKKWIKSKTFTGSVNIEYIKDITKKYVVFVEKGKIFRIVKIEKNV